MPITRTWKTKDGSIKKRTYTTINGINADAYAREQSRRYHDKKRQQHLASCKRERPTIEVPPNVLTQIAKLHAEGTSLRQISNTVGISRYLVTKALAEPAMHTEPYE